MSKTAQNSQLYTDSESGTIEARRFKTLALRYQEIAAASGIKLYPFRSPEMPLFLKASSEDRQKATDFLETIVSIHEETIAAAETPINTQQLLWRALRRFSLVPDTEIFGNITDDVVTLVFDENQQAVFWNLQFFKFASVSVEEMFFGVWHEFTKRAPEFQAMIYEMAVSVITGKIKGTFKTGIPPHEVEEVGTIECIKTIMDVSHGSVLTKNGKFGGLFVIQTMKVIE